MKILGISSSPRVNGNSELLLDEVLRGARSKGAGVEKIALRQLCMEPCRGCGSCERTGECVILDDAQDLHVKFIETDRLVLATPIYFMAHCAQAKVAIDRCQPFWSRKYVLKKKLFDAAPPHPRKGMLVATAGTTFKNVFAGAQATMRALFNVLEMEYSQDLLCKDVDEKVAVLEHPTAMREAFEAGCGLAL